MDHLEDLALPLLSELVEAEPALRLLETALSGTGVHLTGVTISEIVYTPGRRCLVRYQARAEGLPRAETIELVAVTGASLPDGGVRLRSGSDTVVVWAFPDDPALPGLPSVMNPDTTGALLDELGVPPVDLALHVRSYRPGRRAVIEARTAERRVYLKVVRPKKAAALHDAHQALVEHVPVPRSVGWSADLGVVVLEPLPGTPVATLLARGKAGLLPSAGELVHLLDLIAGSTFRGGTRVPSHERVEEHTKVIAAVAPELADAANHLRQAMPPVPAEPEIVAHRDFHGSQLLIDQGTLRLVDIDTVGPGTRADDMATLIGQLVCLARAGPQQAAINGYIAALLSSFEEMIRPASLRPRIAAAITGFAVGPFRIQERRWQVEMRRRIEAAIEWAGPHPETA